MGSKGNFNKKLAVVQHSEKPSKKNVGGRPTKLNKKIIQEMSNLLKMGAYVESVAVAVGLDKQTFYTHLKQGNKDIVAGSYSTLSAILVREVHKATEVAVMRDIQRIDAAASDDWRAAAWKLERRHAAQWGNKSALKLEGEKTGFSDSENLHAQLASLIGKLEKGDDNGSSDRELEHSRVEDDDLSVG